MSRPAAEAARTAVGYLKYEAFAGAEKGPGGGIVDIPFTTVQVEAEARPDLQSQVTSLLGARDAAGNPFCLLVVRTKGQPPATWDAYLPPMWELEYASEPLPEREAWTWVRMDLRLAVVHLGSAIRTWAFRDLYSVSTGLEPSLDRIREWTRSVA